MTTEEKETAQVTENQQPHGIGDYSNEDVLKFKKRMLEWPNPVEYVNNMYGCHPDDDDNEYFKVVYKR